MNDIKFEHKKSKNTEKSKRKTGNIRVGISLLIFLGIVGVCLFFILLGGVFIMRNITFTMLDEMNDVSNLDDLSKEAMAVMDVFKTMSHRFIEKDIWLLRGVLAAADENNYPLDWTKLNVGIQTIEDFKANSGNVNSDNSDFQGEIAPQQMTYKYPSSTTSLTDDSIFKRLNMLNDVWTKINLVKLGYEFDVDITSTFFMIQSTTNANDKLLVTFPGQTVTINDNFADYDFYNSARDKKLLMSDITSDTTDEEKENSYVTIPLQADPFNSINGNVVGYCKWFEITGGSDSYEGVVGIFYKSSLMKKLTEPVAKKAEGIVFSLYQVDGNQDLLLATTDTKGIIEGSNEIKKILKSQRSQKNNLVKNDIFQDGDSYSLEESSSKSKSGASFKATGIYGPYYNDINDPSTTYDFRGIFLQDNEVLVRFSDKMREDINKDFVLVFVLLPFYCILLCIVVGLILYLCVLRPIKELAKASKGILYH